MKQITRSFLIALIALFTVSISASAITPKEKCIRKLEKFTKEVKKNSATYTDEDWDQAMQTYDEITAEMKEFTYNDEELRQIGKLKGRCIGLLARKSLNKGAAELNTLMQQLGGFLEGLLETADLEGTEDDE